MASAAPRALVMTVLIFSLGASVHARADTASGPIAGTETVTPAGSCSGGSQSFAVTETRNGDQLTISSPGGTSAGAISSDGMTADTNGSGGSYRVVANSPTMQTITEMFNGCTYNGTIALNPPGLSLSTVAVPTATATPSSGPAGDEFVDTPPPPVASSSFWPGLTLAALLAALLGLLLLFATTLITGGKTDGAVLEITKEQAAESDPIELGPQRSTIKYTITVTNKGPAAAQNVVVGDYMVQNTQPLDDVEQHRSWGALRDPLEVKIAKEATSDNSEASCVLSKDAQGHFTSGTFKLPLLAKDAVFTVTFQVEPAAAGNIVNGAAVRCDNQERTWRKELTLWIAKHGISRPENDETWKHFFDHPPASFEWAVDAAYTQARVVEPAKK